MRIGIDGYMMPTTGVARGLGTYIKRLVESLPDVLQCDDELVLLTPLPHPVPIPGVTNICWHSPVSQYVWEQVILPLLAFRSGVHVLHCPANTRPLFCSVPVVTTVHDVIMFDPEKKDVYERYVQWATMRALKSSAHVITVSAASKRQLEKRFARSAPITVVHNGPPFNGCQVPAARREGKVVHFAHPNPRKNSRYVLDLAREMPDWEFILIGMSEEEITMRWGVSLSDNVRSCGNVTDEQKRLELASSSALIYISSREGFGFPVLEAQSQGCPVITLSDEAIQEISGKACREVELDVQSMKEAVLWCAENTCDVENIVRLGMENVGRFSWKSAASCTYQLYKAVVV